jgi:cell division initiation protein
MSYTPVELRHVRVARRPLGYHRAGVEQILSDVADSFETVWRDRGELADRVEELEQALAQAKEREQLLTNTLVAAEHAAEEMRERARREAELIVSEAHAEARSVMHQSQAERERLLVEVRRIEILLRSALGIVGDAAPPSEQPAAAAASEEQRDLRPLAAASSGAETAAAEAEPVTDETAAAPEEEMPGWPPLRRVAQAGSDFDWGD